MGEAVLTVEDYGADCLQLLNRGNKRICVVELSSAEGERDGGVEAGC